MPCAEVNSKRSPCHVPSPPKAASHKSIALSSIASKTGREVAGRAVDDPEHLRGRGFAGERLVQPLLQFGVRAPKIGHLLVERRGRWLPRWALVPAPSADRAGPLIGAPRRRAAGRRQIG